MFRHVSVFTLENKEELDHFVSMLKALGRECPTICHSEVGVNFGVGPKEGPGPEFGDVIQIIDFNTKEELERYPSTLQHRHLVEAGPKFVKVSAIDYEIR